MEYCACYAIKERYFQFTFLTSFLDIEGSPSGQGRGRGGRGGRGRARGMP